MYIYILFECYMYFFLYYHILDCPQLSVGERAIASSRETTFGARVMYICPVGQEFSTGGDKILAECMQGGEWNVSHIPSCQGNYIVNLLCICFHILII